MHRSEAGSWREKIENAKQKMSVRSTCISTNFWINWFPQFFASRQFSKLWKSDEILINSCTKIDWQSGFQLNFPLIVGFSERPTFWIVLNLISCMIIIQESSEMSMMCQSALVAHSILKLTKWYVTGHHVENDWQAKNVLALIIYAIICTTF